jgi:hypothetical protein
MKKIFTLLVILLVSQKINSQQSSFVVEHCVDTSIFQPLEGLICSNDTKTKWFTMNSTYVTSTTNPIPNGFSVIKFNIGKSTQNDRLIIRFEDSKTVVLKAYEITQEYGVIMFYASVPNVHVFKNHSIKSIKYVNGDDNENFTYHPNDEEKTFFLNAFTNFIVKDVKCN